MNKMTLLGAVFTMSALAVVGDDPKGAQATVEMQSTQKPKEEKKIPVSPAKPTSEILRKPVIYGGYLTDLVKAEKKRPLFNLRTPIDPQKDLENVWFYPGTDRPTGTVLFSIKF